MHFFKLSKLFEQTLVNQRNSNTVTDAGSDPDRGKYEIKQDYFFIFRLGLLFLITWFTDPPTRILRIWKKKKKIFTFKKKRIFFKIFF